MFDPSLPLLLVSYIILVAFVCLWVRYIFITMVTHPYISAKNKHIDTKLSGYLSWGPSMWYSVSVTTLSSKSPVRNPPNPTKKTIKDRVSWHTSNHARMLNFGTQIWNHVPRTIMSSSMTLVLYVSSLEPPMSSKTLMMTDGFLTHF